MRQQHRQVVDEVAELAVVEVDGAYLTVTEQQVRRVQVRVDQAEGARRRLQRLDDGPQPFRGPVEQRFVSFGQRTEAAVPRLAAALGGGGPVAQQAAGVLPV